MQLCREMGWSEGDLAASSDDFVYYASQVLRWDAEKQREDNKESSGKIRNEPQRIPLRPPPGTPERIEVPDDTPWTGPQLGPAVRAWEP